MMSSDLVGGSYERPRDASAPRLPSCVFRFGLERSVEVLWVCFVGLWPSCLYSPPLCTGKS